MNCPICESEKWKNVDEFRSKPKIDDKPVGMSICETCGFVAYPSKYKSKEEILEYYRKDYRGGAPSFGNITTGDRKLNYHAKFLESVFQDWNKAGMKTPKFGEVGSAIGMVCNWFKKGFPDAEVHGTELTSTYRKVAFHEFGIDLKESLPQDENSYDILMSYKVHEHLCDPDVEMRMYHKLLKDDGLLYISVPTWFSVLENFGAAGFDLDYYYHVDHINVWTTKLFESLLKKCGFEIVKYDNFIYGDTYLCKKVAPQALTAADYEKPDEIIKKMKDIKKVSEFIQSNKFDEAVKTWGNFPMGWTNYYEMIRAQLHETHTGNGLKIVEDFIGQMRNAVGEHPEVYRMHADLLMRYGMVKEAAIIIESCLEKRPNQAGMLMPLSHCFRELSKAATNPDEKMHLILTARDICRRIIQVDKGAMQEAYNWSLKDSSEIDVDNFKKFRDNQQQQQPKGEKDAKSI